MDKLNLENISQKIDDLMHKIPGYTGMQERAARRESDAAHREYMAKRLTELKSNMQSAQEEFLGSGNLSVMEPFDKVANKLDRVIERVRYANRGYAGFFDAVKINEEELSHIYDYDLSLVNIISNAEEALMSIQSAADEGNDPKLALKSLTKCINSFDNALNERELILKGIK
ncbi:MAG: hypothetical protein ACI376_06740 [Candidatus Bruticola sp.]